MKYGQLVYSLLNTLPIGSHCSIGSLIYDDLPIKLLILQSCVNLPEIYDFRKQGSKGGICLGFSQLTGKQFDVHNIS